MHRVRARSRVRQPFFIVASTVLLVHLLLATTSVALAGLLLAAIGWVWWPVIRSAWVLTRAPRAARPRPTPPP